jgi:hypothetical protein
VAAPQIAARQGRGAGAVKKPPHIIAAAMPLRKLEARCARSAAKAGKFLVSALSILETDLPYFLELRQRLNAQGKRGGIEGWGKWCAKHFTCDVRTVNRNLAILIGPQEKRNSQFGTQIIKNGLPTPKGRRYWRTPPDLRDKIKAEIGDKWFDPCPYPRPEGYDSLKEEWESPAYVNPPFRRHDGVDEQGPTAFARKAIEQHKKGKTVVLALPTQSYVNLLLEAGAEIKSGGRPRWLEADSLEPNTSPSPVTLFILRAK